MDKKLFAELVNRYLDGTATDSEKLLVESYYEQLAGEDAGLPTDKTALLKEQMYKNIETAIRKPARVVPMRSKWLRIAAAAIILIAAGVATWQIWFNGNKPAQGTGITMKNNTRQNDINPAKGGAILLLGNGSQIHIDSAANGRLLTADQTSITKKDGQLVYAASAAVTYNTLTTDKGKSYQLTLADGTQVWLDALSSIRFPTAFPGEERVVEITGQAYFEVAHNAKKPFKVKSGEQIIEVLGTHFNVNAHQLAIRTTLLEGSVKIQSATGNRQSAILKPGEQSVFTHSLPRQSGDSRLTIDVSPDVAEVMAWKNGRFRFNGSSVEEIFAQLSRWYDIEVVYEDKVPEVFVANISRDVPLSSVLDLFEMTKQVKFKIEGKKVTVMK